MNLWIGAFRAEGRKALASPVSWITCFVCLFLPLVCGAFVLIVKDPVGAKKLGILGAKAQLSGLTADWPSYLGMLNQALGVGFLFLSALFVSWLFGRESSDRTLKLLLAVPAGRIRVVAAKFLVALVWGTAAVGLMTGAALAIGAAVSIPGFSAALAAGWLPTFVLVGLLTLALSPWVAFAASAGRGFLVPLGFTLATVAVANIAAVLGWGSVVPWAIPSLLAGAGSAASPGFEGVALVLATSLAGMAATMAFWKTADHPR